MQNAKHRSNWKRAIAVLPAVGVALTPKIVCPLCWPAYAGLLSTFGIGFLPTAPYLLPLTIGVLVLALGILTWCVRYDFGPLLLGVAGAVVILIGRFTFDSEVGLYAGITLLVAAFVWDIWRSNKRSGSCPACTTSIVPLEGSLENATTEVSSESRNMTVDSVP